MAHPVVFLALALVTFLSTPLVSGHEDSEHSMRRRETMDSLLQSLLESKARSRDTEADLRALPSSRKWPVSAPLAHQAPQRAQISPSFQLLRVTGAKANLGEESSDSGRNAEALSKKFEYVRELRRQFEERQNS
jgi:hypothetical protein